MTHAPPLRIVAEANPSPQDLETVEEAIHTFNKVVTGIYDYTPVNLFLRDATDTLLGGALGGIWGGWLHLKFLWVHESARGQGHGGRLLRAVEAEARRHNCRGVFLETHSFQARPFYERAGYTVIGELVDYPPGESFYYMRKLLSAAEPRRQTRAASP